MQRKTEKQTGSLRQTIDHKKQRQTYYKTDRQTDRQTDKLRCRQTDEINFTCHTTATFPSICTFSLTCRTLPVQKAYVGNNSMCVCLPVIHNGNHCDIVVRKAGFARGGPACRNVRSPPSSRPPAQHTLAQSVSERAIWYPTVREREKIVIMWGFECGPVIRGSDGGGWPGQLVFAI